MKKILLGTTALVSLFAGSAFAQGPAVTLGGSYEFQAGYVDQDFDTTNPNNRDVKFQNNTRVDVRAEGKTDNGLTYGADVRLQADLTGPSDANGLNAERTYLFAESGFGRLELGSNVDAAAALRVDASTLARATGGIDGNWYDYADLTGVGGSGLPGGIATDVKFITSPNLPTEHIRGLTSNATKITYYTPRFAGVQFGASFTPDQGDAGTAAGFTGKIGTDYEDVFNLGLNYAAQYDQISVKAAATGEFGQNESSAMEDLEAYNVGALVSFAGFGLAGSYGDWQESGQLVAATSGESDYWTAGAGYEQGPFGISVTYLDSDLGDNELELVSFGADYQAAPGLVPYVEVNVFDTDEAGTPIDNSGTVVLAGAELTF